MIKYLLLLGTLVVPGLSVVHPRVTCTTGDDDLYQFNATLLDESANIDFSDYAGKDLVIVGFPCNQFKKQEPGSGYDEIMNGIAYVRPGGGFIPEIILFEKSDVNGDNQLPIYTWLKTYCPYTDSTFRSDTFWSPYRVGDVNWNFGKFLIGRDGKTYTRYHPTTTSAAALKSDINHLLNQPAPKRK